MLKDFATQLFNATFGQAQRTTVKVTAWTLRPDFSVVVQTDQPNKEDHVFVWVPYPEDGGDMPEYALEYSEQSGRHSNTYPSPGLERGKPALKLVVKNKEELSDVLLYVRSVCENQPLPSLKARPEPLTLDDKALIPVDVAAMPDTKPKKARREAIPRAVQREVWQRDGGQCVECDSKAKLCFDHIVPFSKGGANTVRNLQLLCERCNLAKSNRI